MANMCNNWVRITGEKEEVKEFVELVGKDFDFNKVIPTDTDEADEAREKWDCSSIAFDTIFEELSEDEVEWYFTTKWCPPTKIYVALRDRFPDLFLYWRYEESGCDLYGYLNNEDF